MACPGYLPSGAEIHDRRLHECPGEMGPAEVQTQADAQPIQVKISRLDLPLDVDASVPFLHPNQAAPEQYLDSSRRVSGNEKSKYKMQKQEPRTKNQALNVSQIHSRNPAQTVPPHGMAWHAYAYAPVFLPRHLIVIMIIVECPASQRPAIWRNHIVSFQFVSFRFVSCRVLCAINASA